MTKLSSKIQWKVPKLRFSSDIGISGFCHHNDSYIDVVGMSRKLWLNRYLNCRHFLAYYLVYWDMFRVKAKYGQFQLCTDCTMRDIYDSHLHCDPKVRLLV